VSPPWGAVPPEDTAGEFGFDFTRFGPRVPTVLVSPLIPAGTVHRVANGTTPFDHTSVLATLEHRFGLGPLTRRDAAAPDLAAALSLPSPRTDDPLARVSAPPAPPNPTGLTVQPSHLQQVHAALIADHAGIPPAALAPLRTNADYQRFVAEHG
jgi:phospholipase C